MKTERGTVKVTTAIYKGAKARFPVLRTILDILSISAIVTFIASNKYISADKNVLIFLDVILGVFGVFLLLCMTKPIDNYMKMKNFYKTASAINEYEFFANCVGMLQSRDGNVEDCEILSYSKILSKSETKTHIYFTNTQYGVYTVDKSGLAEDELNAVRAALGLPFSGKKMDLPTAKLKIEPYSALIEEKKSTETQESETPENQA